jgi:hypothetical protein
MSTSHRLQLKCFSCHTEIPLPLSELASKKELTCASCKKNYHFDHQQLLDQLGRFQALCEQLQKSQDILSQSSISVTAGTQEVKIPLRLLLTRFNSVLEMQIDGKPMEVQFRVD